MNDSSFPIKLTTTSKDSRDTKLSSGVTISQYRNLENGQNKGEIINFFRERFTERYITPLKSETKHKHGFCTMAVCCLTIEALESFWQGWPNSKGKSERAFCSFFKRNDNLKDFRDYAQDFYKHIRCGILHQAETTGGWHIRREGALFNPVTKTLNAIKFHKQLENCLEAYCDSLSKAAWNDDVWKNLRKKMNVICNNCNA